MLFFDGAAQEFRPSDGADVNCHTSAKPHPQSRILRCSMRKCANQKTGVKVAQALKPAVSKQAVAKGLSGASWHVIRETVRLFERTPWESVLQLPKKTTKNGCLVQDNLKRLSKRRQPKRVV